MFEFLRVSRLHPVVINTAKLTSSAFKGLLRESVPEYVLLNIEKEFLQHFYRQKFRVCTLPSLCKVPESVVVYSDMTYFIKKRLELACLSQRKKTEEVELVSLTILIPSKFVDLTQSQLP